MKLETFRVILGSTLLPEELILMCFKYHQIMIVDSKLNRKMKNVMFVNVDGSNILPKLEDSANGSIIKPNLENIVLSKYCEKLYLYCTIHVHSTNIIEYTSECLSTMTTCYGKRMLSVCLWNEQSYLCEWLRLNQIDGFILHINHSTWTYGILCSKKTFEYVNLFISQLLQIIYLKLKRYNVLRG